MNKVITCCILMGVLCASLRAQENKVADGYLYQTSGYKNTLQNTSTVKFSPKLLDIDYVKPSPTKALMYSAIFPGGGYFYLGDVNSKYQVHSILFLLAGVASYWYVVNQASKNFISAYPAIAIAVSLRIWEFSSVIDAAEKERFKNSMELIRER